MVHCRIVAYSDSEGEDEPFQMARRRKKKKEAEEQSAETGEDEKTEEASTSKASSPARASHRGPRVFRAARLLPPTFL